MSLLEHLRLKPLEIVVSDVHHNRDEKHRSKLFQIKDLKNYKLCHCERYKLGSNFEVIVSSPLVHNIIIQGI